MPLQLQKPINYLMNAHRRADDRTIRYFTAVSAEGSVQEPNRNTACYEASRCLGASTAVVAYTLACNFIANPCIRFGVSVVLGTCGGPCGSYLYAFSGKECCFHEDPQQNNSPTDPRKEYEQALMANFCSGYCNMHFFVPCVVLDYVPRPGDCTENTEEVVVSAETPSQPAPPINQAMQRGVDAAQPVTSDAPPSPLATQQPPAVAYAQICVIIQNPGGMTLTMVKPDPPVQQTTSSVPPEAPVGSIMQRV